MQLTEQEILQDALIAHKFLMRMYAQFGLECSVPALRELFQSLYKVASMHDFKIFEIMNTKGFYPTTPAQAKDVKTAVKMHTQMQTQLEQKLTEK